MGSSGTLDSKSMPLSNFLSLYLSGVQVWWRSGRKWSCSSTTYTHTHTHKHCHVWRIIVRCDHISKNHEPIYVKFGVWGFSSCSSEIWSWKWWRHTSVLYKGWPTSRYQTYIKPCHHGIHKNKILSLVDSLIAHFIESWITRWHIITHRLLY